MNSPSQELSQAELKELAKLAGISVFDSTDAVVVDDMSQLAKFAQLLLQREGVCHQSDHTEGSLEMVEPYRTPWQPYLSDRADGVKGHFAIARMHANGYREVWNLRSHEWAGFSDEVLTYEEALSLLKAISIPTQQPTAPGGEVLKAASMALRGYEIAKSITPLDVRNFSAGAFASDMRNLEAAIKSSAPSPAKEQG